MRQATPWQALRYAVVLAYYARRYGHTFQWLHDGYTLARKYGLRDEHTRIPLRFWRKVHRG